MVEGTKRTRDNIRVGERGSWGSREEEKGGGEFNLPHQLTSCLRTLNHCQKNAISICLRDETVNRKKKFSASFQALLFFFFLKKKIILSKNFNDMQKS